MAETYTREQIVRKLKRLNKAAADSLVEAEKWQRFFAADWARAEMHAFKLAIAAFPPKGSKK